LLEALSAVLLALMVVLVFGNVVLRYAFNSGITLSEELSRWLFVWLTFLGAIVALREHCHLGSDLLVSRLPHWAKKLCLLASQALMLFVTCLLFEGSLAQARINWDVAAPTSGASMAIFYAAGIVFALSAALILLRDMLRLITGKADNDLITIRQSEESKKAPR
jgi:TRAP-type transport system small permease protein